jgi:predicted XRE-type DNA-binding protein
MAYENAFDALGVDREDATVRALRADMSAIVRDWIKQRGLTQKAAGEQLGITQSAVSDIIAGRIGRMSFEYFVRMLTRIDVAWTARSWSHPHDSRAVKGPAPADWIGVGATVSRSFISLAGVASPVVSPGSLPRAASSAVDSGGTVDG